MAKITSHNHHEKLYCVIDQILSVQFKIVGGRQGLWIELGVTVKETGSGAVELGGHYGIFSKTMCFCFLGTKFP